MIDEKEYFRKKRLDVLEAITPICKAFNITDFDYIVSEDCRRERLRVYNILIGCSSNSISAVVDELVGYIFVKKYCRNRYIGAFKTQTLNVITRYWIKEAQNERD